MVWWLGEIRYKDDDGDGLGRGEYWQQAMDMMEMEMATIKAVVVTLNVWRQTRVGIWRWRWVKLCTPSLPQRFLDLRSIATQAHRWFLSAERPIPPTLHERTIDKYAQTPCQYVPSFESNTRELSSQEDQRRQRKYHDAHVPWRQIQKETDLAKSHMIQRLIRRPLKMWHLRTTVQKNRNHVSTKPSPTVNDMTYHTSFSLGFRLSARQCQILQLGCDHVEDRRDVSSTRSLSRQDSRECLDQCR